MTGSAGRLDLIVLDDGVQGVAVRLLSPTPQYDHYEAEIVIRSDFVNATVRTDCTVGDFDDWAVLLDAVAEGDDDSGTEFSGAWPVQGRAAYLVFVVEDPYVVEVHDGSGTQISVRVPVDLKAGWIEAARERLVAVRGVVGV
ncbi:DUF5959 family protein [Streptomyces sp. NRRL B-24085]|uniref:DUF5959 family protein n=1 Tax=Streptomyces sp. NRRL B-24085 TaxID=1709476 RepID=UPI0006B32D4B|nr:DUF5959 family protein [Streptomyces sp. NRRL B-24085]